MSDTMREAVEALLSARLSTRTDLSGEDIAAMTGEAATIAADLDTLRERLQIADAPEPLWITLRRGPAESAGR